MWPSIAHRLKIRKLQRRFWKTVNAYAVGKAMARVHKKSADEINQIDEQKHWELSLLQDEMDLETSNYLMSEAHRYLVPVPREDEDWTESTQLGTRFLSRKGAKQVRDDIRTEQKASWDYWQSRVTFALAIIGSIFGVLAFFKK